MVGRLITFPLRVSVRSAQLWFRAAEEVAGRATTGALRVAGLFTRDGNDSRSMFAQTHAQRSRRSPARDPRLPDTRPAPPRPEPVSAQHAAARVDRSPEPEAFPPRTPAPEPSHVSEEATLVREEAEPGTEDGAGASLTIEEPWEGYARMSAKDVIARLADSSPAELAAVSLYESGNRSRQTVLAAVQRQLRAVNGGGS